MRALPWNVGGTKHTRKGVRSGSLEARSEAEQEEMLTGKLRSIDLGMPGCMMLNQQDRVDLKP